MMNTMKTPLALLSVILLCAALSAASPRPLRQLPRSPPLDSSSTWNNLMEMVKDAQAQDRDHETRLIPVIPSEKLRDTSMCCPNIKILRFYLNDILHNESYSRMQLVRHDLHRVARDLESHCNSHLADLEHFQTFTQNLVRAGEMYKNNIKAQNKAIGEANILFHYLYETCKPPGMKL
ncbi:interleukin-22 [Astyanax mexicanus]|uniref:Interleukin-22 n=2 Tax=Astyanax mexicanus TaxID=7994 RepID=A0A8B9JAI6_ASTMX|nr:interleukin-22 [Astyanax mexicanus]KAG9280322.1 interleukin-22 [Astyanax mexicanus]